MIPFAMIVSFALPAAAWNRRALAGLVLVGAAGLGTLMVLFEGEMVGDDALGHLTVRFLGIPLVAGACARALSLWTAGRGHGRPHSIWIELVVGAAVLYALL